MCVYRTSLNISPTPSSATAIVCTGPVYIRALLRFSIGAIDAVLVSVCALCRSWGNQFLFNYDPAMDPELQEVCTASF